MFCSEWVVTNLGPSKTHKWAQYCIIKICVSVVLRPIALGSSNVPCACLSTFIIMMVFAKSILFIQSPFRIFHWETSRSKVRIVNMWIQYPQPLKPRSCKKNTPIGARSSWPWLDFYQVDIGHSVNSPYFNVIHPSQSISRIAWGIRHLFKHLSCKTSYSRDESWLMSCQIWVMRAIKNN